MVERCKYLHRSSPDLVDMYVFLPMEFNGVFPQLISVVPRLKIDYADMQLGGSDDLVQAMAWVIRRCVDMSICRCVHLSMSSKRNGEAVAPYLPFQKYYEYSLVYTHILSTMRVCALPQSHL